MDSTRLSSYHTIPSSSSSAPLNPSISLRLSPSHSRSSDSDMNYDLLQASQQQTIDKSNRQAEAHTNIQGNHSSTTGTSASNSFSSSSPSVSPGSVSLSIPCISSVHGLVQLPVVIPLEFFQQIQKKIEKQILRGNSQAKWLKMRREDKQG